MPGSRYGFTITTLVPSLLGLVQVFGRDGLVVRRIGAKENDQVGAVPILVAAGGRRDTRPPSSSPRWTAHDTAARRYRRCWCRETAPLSAPCNKPRSSRRARSQTWPSAADRRREFSSRCAHKPRPRKCGGNPAAPFSRNIGYGRRPSSRNCALSSAARRETSSSRRTSSAGMVFRRSKFSRVMQRCTPLMVQSWNPATPSAHPSQTPRLNTFQA